MIQQQRTAYDGSSLRGWRTRVLMLKTTEIAAKAGLSTAYISRMERGSLTPPYYQLTTLATAYGLSLSEFADALSRTLRGEPHGTHAV